jgi:hypothetical protein
MSSRRAFRAPSPQAAARDLEALERGEGLVVSCFLRGLVAPYPRRWKQGSLELMKGRISWRPLWALRRRPILVDKHVRSVEVKPIPASAWNVKKGGRAFGLVSLPDFQMVVATADRTVLEFIVPCIDVQLVVSAIKRDGAREYNTQ